MEKRITLAGLVAVIGLGSVEAQVVQLPSYHHFSVNTSVLAPDRGGASLGGVRRSAYGRTAFGVPVLSKLPGLGRLFSNRATGSAVSVGSVSVHATIIDHHELDLAVLAAAKGHNSQALADPEAREFSERLQPTTTADQSEERLLSVAEIRRQNATRNSAAKKTQEDLAANLFAQGRQAEADGHLGAAKIYYGMAAKRAGVDLKKQIAARLSALEPRPATTTVGKSPVKFRR